MKIKITCILFLAFIMVSSKSFAGYFDEPDYVIAFKESKPLAERGDLVAMFNLGFMYYRGLGVPQDKKEALSWFLKAAKHSYIEQDYPDESTAREAKNSIANASNFLGYMFEHSLGVTQDYVQAEQWYLKAAELGQREAAYNLGEMYYQGLGVQQDDAKAEQWYLQATPPDGSGEAMDKLDLLYESGRVLPKDYEQIAELYHQRSWFSARTTPRDPQRYAQVVLYHAKSLKWYRKAADQGNAHAMYRAGALYEEGYKDDNGEHQDRDYSQALSWYGKAAAQGNAEAQNVLGDMYASGRGVVQDHAKAAKWYREAIQHWQGDSKFIDSLRAQVKIADAISIWEKRFQYKLKEGDPVCTYTGNFFGNVEKIVANRIKVFLIGQVTTYAGQFYGGKANDGFFYGGHNTLGSSSGASGSFNYEKIEAQRWLERNELAPCSFNP